MCFLEPLATELAETWKWCDKDFIFSLVAMALVSLDQLVFSLKASGLVL